MPLGSVMAVFWKHTAKRRGLDQICCCGAVFNYYAFVLPKKINGHRGWHHNERQEQTIVADKTMMGREKNKNKQIIENGEENNNG